ncbi:MAG: response regulator [Erythrobacter sp.]
MTQRTVIVVEDDPKIAALVTDFLAAEGFAVTSFGDGRSIVGAVKLQEPALVILDIMLPAGDGHSLARSIREFSKVPIMMLSARREEEDKLHALDGGADDYVTKPFSGKELAARAKALIRRAEGLILDPQSEPYHVDQEAQQILWQGQLLNLSQSEFRILAAMIARPGKVFSRDALLDTLGDRSEESTDRAIDSHIKNLRKKISAADGAAKPIDAVYGSGYRFHPPSAAK